MLPGNHFLMDRVEGLTLPVSWVGFRCGWPTDLNVERGTLGIWGKESGWCWGGLAGAGERKEL